jgi:hypothetical protein
VDAPTPLRPDDGTAERVVPVTLGGQAKRLPELRRIQNRDFQAYYAVAIRDTIQAAGELNDLEDVIELMSSSIDKMMEIILVYDKTGATGGREWVDANATDREIYEAFKKVTHAAHPFGQDILGMIPDLRAMLLRSMMRMVGSKSTSSSRQNTDGRQTKSTSA